MIDDEVLGEIRVARRPIEVDEETLALDVVKAAGPGGTVLGHAHTRRHAHDGMRRTIMNRAPYETWRVARRPAISRPPQRARVTELLESYEPPDDLDPVVRRQLDAYCLG